MADIYDECILGLDLMRKYGLIVVPKSRLLRAPHGDIPLLALETTAIQQACSKVDPVQELVKSCQETLSAEQITSLKKTLHDYCDVFAQHENDLGQTSLIQHQIRVLLAKHEEMEFLFTCNLIKIWCRNKKCICAEISTIRIYYGVT